MKNCKVLTFVQIMYFYQSWRGHRRGHRGDPRGIQRVKYLLQSDE